MIPTTWISTASWPICAIWWPPGQGGGLRASELADTSAITVSSLGERGVDRLYGILYPPQVAIVGFGTPRPAPWVLEDRVVPRQVVTVTLAADHRLMTATVAPALPWPRWLSACTSPKTCDAERWSSI